MDIQILKNWLTTCPGWELEPATDETEPVPVSVGLFPKGSREIDRREDVLGNVQLRVQDRFLIVRNSPQTPEENAQLLLCLQKWISEQCVAGQAPVFGSRQRIRAENGQRKKDTQSGTALYTVDLTVEYTVSFPSPELSY